MLPIAPLVWGEIPVTDMDRAIAFYQHHFTLAFKNETMGDMEYAVLLTEQPDAASIGLIKHTGTEPSLQGSVVYLHLSDKLQPLLDRLASAGVEILMPATGIKDGECGYCAQFVDSEGNRVGLWARDLA
ncbi:VOC family protein [Shewanella salipaludis]|uniref:VOC family protein n=1 Tax=Shewanella salipaludis TaxID=2723052 RepID=A0A972JLV9_9GAMM|nr:VOC family protein [Shewanella salipaludis]NMH64476.1 VOC family protein [Shewanella salipaludis]